MAKRVYISPSDQVENKYAWGNTNEHVQCQRIAEAEAKQASEAPKADPVDKLAQNIAKEKG